jgi:hypothetical protein
VGAELLGREFSEPLLLSLAYAYEQAAKTRKLPERWSSSAVRQPPPQGPVDSLLEQIHQLDRTTRASAQDLVVLTQD